MARRSDHSREELYEMALAAARDIVVADGLSGLTVRRVATAIGYSPGTLYNVFDDFYELVIHLNSRTLDAFYGHLLSASEKESARPELEQLIDGYLSFVKDQHNLWDVLFEYRLPDGRKLPDWYLAKIGRMLSLVEKALEPFAPKANPEELAEYARVYWASVHGICSLYGSGQLQVVSGQTVRHMVMVLTERFVSGLKR